jgi:hypothetical protein
MQSALLHELVTVRQAAWSAVWVMMPLAEQLARNRGDVRLDLFDVHSASPHPASAAVGPNRPQCACM